MQSMNTDTATARPSAAPTSGQALMAENAVQLFNERIKLSADKPVFRWKEQGSWREALWRDWDRAAREVAGGLRALGVGQGERSCIIGDTRPEWLHADIGIAMAGGVTVPIYQSNLPHECEYIINDSG